MPTLKIGYHNYIIAGVQMNYDISALLVGIVIITIALVMAFVFP
jgi:hypothetical protein